MKLGNYIIDFHHNYDLPGYKGGTMCRIVIGDNNYDGESFCCVNDQFNKKIGRKIALTRALQIAWMIPKEERKDIWNDYFKQVKK